MQARRTHSAARVRGVRAASIDDRAEAEVLLQLLEDVCSVGLYEYTLDVHPQGRHGTHVFFAVGECSSALGRGARPKCIMQHARAAGCIASRLEPAYQDPHAICDDGLSGPTPSFKIPPASDGRFKEFPVNRMGPSCN